MSDASETKSSGVQFVRPAPSTMLAWNALKKVDVPLALKLFALTIVFFTLLPLALAARERTDTNKRSPRIHLIQDMDNQPKMKAQQPSKFFVDGRSNRPPVVGTVAQGQLGLATDPVLYEGLTVSNGEPQYVTGYPPAIQAILDDTTEVSITDPADPMKMKPVSRSESTLR